MKFKRLPRVEFVRLCHILCKYYYGGITIWYIENDIHTSFPPFLDPEERLGYLGARYIYFNFFKVPSQ